MVFVDCARRSMSCELPDTIVRAVAWTDVGDDCRPRNGCRTRGAGSFYSRCSCVDVPLCGDGGAVVSYTHSGAELCGAYF